MKTDELQCNVMISSAGRRVALLGGFQAAMAALGLGGRVVANDCSPLSAAYHRAQSGYLVPRCDEPSYFAAIAEICRREAVTLLIPTIDTELAVYARSRDNLIKAGTTVHISAPETVTIGNDKVLTHEWLSARGFPTVGQWDGSTIPADARLPLIAKPRFGSASMGVRKVNSREELDALRGDPGMVIQEIAPGKEHTIDVFVDRRGRCLCAVPRRRLEVRAGEVSKGVTVREPALERLAMEIAEALPGASGVLNIQVFSDPPSGRVSVIEVNPRFGGGVPLSIAAGADFPRWVLEETLGLPCGANPGVWRAGVVMLRWDDAVFVNADEIGLAL